MPHTLANSMPQNWGGISGETRVRHDQTCSRSDLEARPRRPRPWSESGGAGPARCGLRGYLHWFASKRRADRRGSRTGRRGRDRPVHPLRRASADCAEADGEIARGRDGRRAGDRRRQHTRTRRRAVERTRRRGRVPNWKPVRGHRGVYPGEAGCERNRRVRGLEREKGVSMPEKTREVILESGIPVKPVYGPDDLSGIEPISQPGEFPFTRGIHPLMYRARPWTMRQYAGFGTPAETNERFKFLIANGQNALNVAFDLPTQMGLDSDDSLAEGEVGRVGMAVDTLADMEVAFDRIPIDKISVSLTMNAVAAPIMAMYFVVAEKHGVPPAEGRGTAQKDIP